MCQIDINGIKITLTEDQLRAIDNQRSNITTIDNLNYSRACKVLSIKERGLSDYDDYLEYLEHQLKTIIKAANYLDNCNSIWKPDFDNQNEYKYYNWLEKKKSGWVFDFVRYRCCSSFCSVGFYFKKESTAKIIAKNHLELYSKVWG